MAGHDLVERTHARLIAEGLPADEPEDTLFFQRAMMAVAIDEVRNAVAFEIRKIVAKFADWLEQHKKQ